MKNYPELKCYKLALQVSSSLTGSLKTSAEILDNQNRWSKIQGKRSIGRWAVGSTRTAVGTAATDDDTAAGADLDMDSLPDLPQLKLQTSYNAEWIYMFAVRGLFTDVRPSLFALVFYFPFFISSYF
jgi:hypothetical protein